MSAIEVVGLTKNYGNHGALRGVDFSIETGEVVGFLGPNSAGKSTAMKIITGFLTATSGLVRVQGYDVLDHPIKSRSCIGYLPENAPIYPDMRISEYLDYVGRIRGLGRAERKLAISKVADQCGITERLGQRVGALSKGYRQRVGLAQAMIHSPSILILDEPTTGLDPNQIVEIRKLIRKIGRSKTVVLSTHILSEVQATCDRVIIINKGELVADGSTQEITSRQLGGQLLQVTFASGTVEANSTQVSSWIEAIDGVERFNLLEAPEKGQHTFEVLAKCDVRGDLFNLAALHGLTMLELSQDKNSLEEVFRRLTS